MNREELKHGQTDYIKRSRFALIEPRGIETEQDHHSRRLLLALIEPRGIETLSVIDSYAKPWGFN